ncbi:MAG TPA: hypothetical protein VFM19_03155 [Candidatus Limnocylindria bacterium]|nr:hypothetical protein [Candidatus Limnocylindria bacterium]
MTEGRRQTVTDELERRGLAAPVGLLIDAHRPFRPLLEDLATMLAPVLRPLVGDPRRTIGAIRDAVRPQEPER